MTTLFLMNKEPNNNPKLSIFSIKMEFLTVKSKDLCQLLLKKTQILQRSKETKRHWIDKSISVLIKLLYSDNKIKLSLKTSNNFSKFNFIFLENQKPQMLTPCPQKLPS